MCDLFGGGGGDSGAAEARAAEEQRQARITQGTASINEAFGGFGDERRTIEPVCGTIAQDLWGKAQGHWFSPDMDPKTGRGSEDTTLAMSYDVVDPSISAFSIGRALENKGLPSNIYSFKPKSSGLIDRDFKDVEPDGNKYCYIADSKNNGYPKPTGILIEMTDEKTLRVGKLNGDTCSGENWDYKDGFVDFVR